MTYGRRSDDMQLDAEGEVRITYSVRELLARIELNQAEGFASMKSALSTKADKSDVARLETRLDGHATRIDDLETKNHDRALAAKVHAQRDRRVSIFKNKWTRAIAVGLGVLATVVGPIVGSNVHL